MSQDKPLWSMEACPHKHKSPQRHAQIAECRASAPSLPICALLSMNRIFEPLKINKITMKNRILMSSMHLNVEGPQQYDRMVRFYSLRAKHDVGLIITAGCSPNLRGRGTLESFSIDDDSLVSEHARIVRSVHAEGGKIALQLLHFGREALHGKLVAPSSLRLVSNLFTPAALRPEEVFQIIEDFGTAARRAVAAGYDAIELVFSQGFLIHQFLASATNIRTDEWGGDFTGRVKFALAVASTVRKAVGPDFPLIFRLPCLDMLDNGLSLDETETLIRLLEPIGIDLLNVSIGWHESRTPTIAMQVPRGGFVQVARCIKHSFPHLVVAVSNRLNDLRMGEQILLDGVADVIAMGRPFLADPQIITKSKAGQFDQVNTCIACNQSCLDHVFLNKEVSCAVNPEAVNTTEGEYPRFKTTPEIAVIGGGLAGMSAAYYLTKRGAKVVLFEKSQALGGQVNMAAKIPGKSELAETVRFFKNALSAGGTEIRLECRFEPQHLTQNQFKHVFVATGSCPTKFQLPGVKTQIYFYNEVLQHELPIEFPVAIIGAGGVACDTAKYLLLRKTSIENSLHYLGDNLDTQYFSGLQTDSNLERKVTIFQRSTKKVAYRLGRTTRWIVVQQLEKLGVDFARGAHSTEFTATGLKVDLGTDEEIVFPAKTVIFAAGQTPNLGGLDFVFESGTSYTVIGAATRSSSQNASISNSIRMGYESAMALQL